MDDERCTIKDELLDEIADRAGVPSEKSAAFSRFIRVSIRELWRGFDLPASQVYQGPIIEEISSYLEAIAKVKELIADDEGEGALRPARVHARGQVTAFLAGMKKDDFDEFLDSCLSGLGDLERAGTKAKSLIEQTYNANGHRYGAQDGNTSIDQFLYSLIYHIKSCGGKLRTSRTGTLHSAKTARVYVIDLLELMKPCLPPKFPTSSSLAGVCETIGTRVNADLRETPTAK